MFDLFTTMEITKELRNQKQELLTYFRDRANEYKADTDAEFGRNEYKKKARTLNSNLISAKNTIIETLKQKAHREEWTNLEQLECVLMITYTNYVVMLEVRHEAWNYEYMTFSRRIGELWEPFCKLCFDFPINDIELFVPPLFSEVKDNLTTEIEDYIDELPITGEQKTQLKEYYNKVWGFVTSGEIKLELDLHFIYEEKKYVVDFKSGFGSNEKGNTNRLLLVASVYKSIEDDYEPLIFVRAVDNNNYFNTLRDSGIWEAYSGTDTYEQINIYSGYDIHNWIEEHIDWEVDLNQEFVEFLRENELLQYLVW